jgi:hypothetical protein
MTFRVAFVIGTLSRTQWISNENSDSDQDLNLNGIR